MQVSLLYIAATRGTDMLAGHVHVESIIFLFYHRKNKLQQLSKLV